MKPFKLQALLDYRKRLADKAHEALLACMEAREAIAEARDAEAKEIGRLCREFENAKARDFDVPEMILYEQCITSKKRKLQALEEQLVQAEEKVREKRRDLVSARQKKRVLEILKEKRANAEQRRLERQENMFLDEIAVLGYGGGK